MSDRLQPWLTHKQNGKELQFFIQGMPIRGKVTRVIAGDIVWLELKLTDSLLQRGQTISPVTGQPTEITIFPEGHKLTVNSEQIAIAGEAHDEKS